MKISLKIILSFLCVFSIPLKAQAAVINSTNYDIYIGDVDGDALSDYYFVGKPSFIIIVADISIPLAIFPDNFVIYRRGDTYLPPSKFSLASNTLSSLLLAKKLRLAQLGTDVSIWAGATANQTNILLKGADSSSPGVMLSSNANSSLPTISKIITSKIDEAADKSAVVVWAKVASAMVKNDRSSLNQYFDPNVIAKYTQAFDRLGSQLSDIGKQLGDIEPLYISSNTAIYMLTKKGDDGGDYIHTIRFIKDKNGDWKVNEL